MRKFINITVFAAIFFFACSDMDEKTDMNEKADEEVSRKTEMDEEKNTDEDIYEEIEEPDEDIYEETDEQDKDIYEETDETVWTDEDKEDEEDYVDDENEKTPYNDFGDYELISEKQNFSSSYDILIYRPEKSGSYPVFMFQLGANGFGSDAIDINTYDLFMEHLASYGFIVIIIGDSSAGMPNGNSFKESYEWLKNKTEDEHHWLNEYADMNRFVVGGHSNGGVNAAAFLVENQNEVDGIVFMDSYPSPGVIGMGAHDVSSYEGSVLSMAADENTPDRYKEGAEKFKNADCITFLNIEGLDHGGFGDYVHADQPVGPVGREKATEIIRYFLASWFLSEFYESKEASEFLTSEKKHPDSVKEFINTCGL